MSPRQRVLLAAVVLVAFVGWTYAPVRRHEFLTYDDHDFVSENPVVLRGLTVDGVRWAFTTTKMGNWHPLTWLSHMLDVQLFGREPGAHHVMNVVFHVANTLLLFGLLQRLTGEPWPSLVVAALFALHPLHVESVAWIAERKDVLSTFFGLLTVWAYVRYVEQPSRSQYGAIVALFACALMAKPMLVTLPGVLLLLDWWPLRRTMPFDEGRSIDVKTAARTAERTPTSRGRRPRHVSRAAATSRRADRRDPLPLARLDPLPLARLVGEKLPLLALSGLISMVTVATQGREGAVVDLGTLPVQTRIANALVSYVRYLVKLVWPVDLALIYPFDPVLPSWQPVAAAFLLVGVTVALLRAAPRHPYAIVGWLWYLGTLVPVIGFIQVGAQAYADRYTYLPLVGIFIALVWAGRRLLPTSAVAPTVVGLLGACAVMTSAYLRVWATSESVLAHTIAVTRDNFVAENNLGFALTRAGRSDAAIEHYRAALRINPEYVHAYNNLGGVLTQVGRFSEAIEQYEHALQRRPDSFAAHNNLGYALAHTGQSAAAIGHYEEALRLQPDYVEAHYNLGMALGREDRYEEAIAHLREAVRLRPEFATAHSDLGTALARAGQMDEAVSHFQQALQLDPSNAAARRNLETATARRSAGGDSPAR